MVLEELIFTLLPLLAIPITIVYLLAKLFSLRHPTICIIGLHSYKHAKDVKHIAEELVDSHYVCVKCRKERVRVYNMWGNKVQELYIKRGDIGGKDCTSRKIME